MRTIRIKGTRPRTHPFPIISWLIRLITWSRISHVVIDFNSNIIFHANFNKLEFLDSNNFFESVYTIYDFVIPLSDKQYYAILSKCQKLSGIQKGYFAHLIGVALSLPFRLLNIHFRNYIAEHYNSYTCSMLVTELLKEHTNVNILKDSNIYIENITEKDVVSYLNTL